MGSPFVRALAVAAGILFVAAFFVMTLIVAARDGITVLVVFALIVVVLLGLAVLGALGRPPDAD